MPITIEFGKYISWNFITNIASVYVPKTMVLKMQEITSF